MPAGPRTVWPRSGAAAAAVAEAAEAVPPQSAAAVEEAAGRRCSRATCSSSSLREQQESAVLSMRRRCASGWRSRHRRGRATAAAYSLVAGRCMCHRRGARACHAPDARAIAPHGPPLFHTLYSSSGSAPSMWGVLVVGLDSAHLQSTFLRCPISLTCSPAERRGEGYNGVL